MFTKSVQKFTGKICEVEIGKGEKAIKIGGENVLAFYSFDGSTGNIPKVGMEILDVYPVTWIDTLKDLYKDVSQNPAVWAKFVEDKFSPDFICLRLEGADPNGLDKSVIDTIKIVKEVANAITLPLVIAGTGNYEKDAKLFEEIAKVLEGKNVLLLSAVVDNYKRIAAAGVLAYNQKIAAESSVDINLAKQLNILIGQLGVKNQSIVENVGCAAVGYGFEYVVSTIDRIKLAALEQDYKALQMPIITPVSFEVNKVKEAVELESDYPEWGNQEDRAITLEISTAAGVLAAGSNAVVLRQ